MYTSETKGLWMTKYANIVVSGIPWHVFFNKAVFNCENLTFNVGY